MRLSGKFRANTEMLASVYYLVSRMHHEAERCAYLDLTNSEVVEKVKGGPWSLVRVERY